MTWSEEVHQYRTKEHDKNKKLAESEINTDKSSFRDYIAFTLVATVVMGLIYMLRSKNSAPRKKPRDPREAAANAAERRREMSSSNVGTSSGIRTANTSYKDSLLKNLKNSPDESKK